MYFKTLIKPILTEKMAILQERENKYAFFVPKNCNKNTIKKAVESKFDVKVIKVSTMNQSGKQKQMTVKSGGRTIRTSGTRSSFKKAIVTLHEGDRIDLVGGEVTVLVMGVKKLKPTTPGSRFATRADFSELTTSSPEKRLTRALRKKGGRNNTGRITIRRRGGGHKRRYRIIDFKRNKLEIPGKVATIEYDPNRSAYISLIHYIDGDKRYIISPEKLKVGDDVISGENVPLKNANSLPLKNIPAGINVHNIELSPGKGGQMARSAGSYAQVMAHDNKLCTLKLPSGEVRMVLDECRATIGQVGNRTHEQIVSGKAGRTRWLGRRPKVRGVAMNPVDHPMGGGEGKSSGGRHPSTPWGKPTKGYKTRKKNKKSNSMIVKRRK